MNIIKNSWINITVATYFELIFCIDIGDWNNYQIYDNTWCKRYAQIVNRIEFDISSNQLLLLILKTTYTEQDI